MVTRFTYIQRFLTHHRIFISPDLTHATLSVNRDIDGLIKSVNDGSSSAFMWEHFTTKPYVDKGDVRVVRLFTFTAHTLRPSCTTMYTMQIGFIPTPWPSWVIAASTSAPSSEVRTFVETLSKYVREFNSQEKRNDPNANVAFIKENYGYQEEDIVVGKMRTRS
jgi:hypothetical protein